MGNNSGVLSYNAPITNFKPLTSQNMTLQYPLQMKTSGPISCRIFKLVASIAVFCAGSSAWAVDIVKDDNTDNLSLTTSWVGGVVPGSGDVAVWDDTVVGANTTVLGADLAWSGIRLGGTTESEQIRINPGNTLTLGTGGIDLSASPRDLFLNTSVVVDGNQTWNIADGRRLTFWNVSNGAALTGTGNLTKQGAGMFYAHNNLLTNSYSGTLTIEEGSLGIGANFLGSDSTGEIVLKHGTQVVNMSTAVASVTLLANSNVTHMEGTISLVGTTAGTSDSTRLVFAVDRNVTRAVNLRSNVEINVENPLNELGGGYVQVSGISESGGSHSLTKTGPGMLVLGRNISTYTGGTFINEGILQLGGGGAANRMPSTSPVEIDGGVLSIVGAIGNQTIGDLTLIDGSIEGDDSVQLIASSYAVQSGSISKLIGGASSTLTKSTAGTVELSAAASYGGATTINGGTLLVTNTGSISDTSAITVNAGGRLIYSSDLTRTGSIVLNGNGSLNRAVLGGSGTINTAVSLSDLGDTLAPGNSPGILSFGTNQSWDSFTYEWETNDFTGTIAGTDFDSIGIDGSLALTGGIGAYVLDIISLNPSNEPGDVANFSETNRDWIILTTTSGITGFDADNWTLDSTGFSSDPAWLGSWSLEHVGNDLVLSYQAIPEAGTWYLLGLVSCCVVLVRRRRLNRR